MLDNKKPVVLITPQHHMLKMKVIDILLELSRDADEDEIILKNSYGGYTKKDIIKELKNDSTIGIEIVYASIINNFDAFTDVIRIVNA